MRPAFSLVCVLVAGSLLHAVGVSAGVGAPPLDIAGLRAGTLPPNAIWLESLGLEGISQSWGSPQAGKSVEGRPLSLAGAVYTHGIGTHANSEMTIHLKGVATHFVAIVGVDDESGTQGSVVFRVEVDGKVAVETPVLRGGDPPRLVTVKLAGAQRMVLRVLDGGDQIGHDHADWAAAALLLDPHATDRPAMAISADPSSPAIARRNPDRTAINGPRVVGCSPNRPFLFLIPATGKPPLRFRAKGLPKGLTLDEASGIIAGRIEKTGDYTGRLTVTSASGKAQRKLTIRCGEHKLAQTPPLGWNSWNVWGCAVTAERVRQAADAMVDSGLAAHGFQYVNIDDCWEAGRDANGEIQTNEKFGDMKALADYVHAKGLKLGIYSSPGPKTCAGYEASYQHEQQDADTWARWGIDYVKYDWCSYGGIAKDNSLEELQKPYRVMRAALDRCGRDIVFSLCQYGMGNVWEWGADVGGNLWRTTGDITDTWGSLSEIGFGQAGKEPFAGPGHWNDPDMLVVGKVGWGPDVRNTRLSRHEQLTHITLWSLLAAPLLLGCDLTQLDEFTLDLMCNDEVLAVNQDPLGKQAGRVAVEGQAEVWARPLWDGTVAVGLFNRGAEPVTVTAHWKDLGLRGKKPVRDLWRQSDLGKYEDTYSATVAPHSAVLVKIGKPDRTD